MHLKKNLSTIKMVHAKRTIHSPGDVQMYSLL